MNLVFWGVVRGSQGSYSTGPADNSASGGLNSVKRTIILLNSCCCREWRTYFQAYSASPNSLCFGRKPVSFSTIHGIAMRSKRAEAQRRNPRRKRNEKADIWRGGGGGTMLTCNPMNRLWVLGCCWSCTSHSQKDPIGSRLNKFLQVAAATGSNQNYGRGIKDKNTHMVGKQSK